MCFPSRHGDHVPVNPRMPGPRIDYPDLGRAMRQIHGNLAVEFRGRVVLRHHLESDERRALIIAFARLLKVSDTDIRAQPRWRFAADQVPHFHVYIAEPDFGCHISEAGESGFEIKQNYFDSRRYYCDSLWRSAA